MGTIIAGSAWLYEWAREGRLQGEVARRLLQMQVACARRTGHNPNIDTQQARSAIAHSARWGRVADVVVACTECGCTATLSQWERSTRLPTNDLHMVAEGMGRTGKPWEWTFLQHCVGREAAAVLEETESMPRGEARAARHD